MNPPTPLRLLPWTSPEGKPCFLSTAGGYLSRLADDMEAVLLAMGAEVLGLARRVLDDPRSPYAEVRSAGRRLAECLSDAMRVAESRGGRLPLSGVERETDADGADPAAENGGQRPAGAR